MNEFTHVDKQGKASMVDVSGKIQVKREATASGFIKLHPETVNKISDNQIKKGDVLTVAKIAGIQAAKNTSSLIPLCHPLQISKVDVETKIKENGVEVTCYTKCIGQTGIEMEALTGVNVALLTIYDMCKAIDKNMSFENIKLLEKKKTEL
jgi:cyclic pyranopterin phosphate synthase